MFPAAVIVSVEMVGTVGVVLIFSVLVLVALLNDVMILEPEWLTMPPALFVIAKIVPEPLMLMVPVLVKLRSTVADVAALLKAKVPALVLVAIEHPPPVIFTVPEVFDKMPDPVIEVAELIVPVFVRVTPVIVSNVATVNVPLFV